MPLHEHYITLKKKLKRDSRFWKNTLICLRGGKRGFKIWVAKKFKGDSSNQGFRLVFTPKCSLKKHRQKVLKALIHDSLIGIQCMCDLRVERTFCQLCKFSTYQLYTHKYQQSIDTPQTRINNSIKKITLQTCAK